VVLLDKPLSLHPVALMIKVIRMIAGGFGSLRMVVALNFGLLGVVRETRSPCPTCKAGRLARNLWSEVKSNSRNYFPMQNVLKIKFNMSSFVVAPVIESSGRRAP
jgi:hypothetical protein